VKIGRYVPALVALLALAGTYSAIGSPPPATNPAKVRVAAISFVPTKLDLAGNADRLEAAFRKAAAGGAKLAVAPEGALDGYVINQVLTTEVPLERLKAIAIEIDHPVMRRFETLAKELRLCLVFGLAERIGDEIFNTAVFIDGDGLIRGKYHKMQFAEGYDPDWWFNRLGTKSRAFDTPFGRCGILICNDRWSPELARIPALDGAQYLIIPAFGSTSKSQDAAVLSRARETGLPVIEANVGVSLIVSEGEVVALEREKDAIVFAEIAIPAAKPARPDVRDEVEREFIEWRAVEMRRRFEARNHRFAQPGSTGVAR
jgi:predicted amidohydrolase